MPRSYATFTFYVTSPFAYCRTRILHCLTAATLYALPRCHTCLRLLPARCLTCLLIPSPLLTCNACCLYLYLFSSASFTRYLLLYILSYTIVWLSSCIALHAAVAAAAHLLLPCLPTLAALPRLPCASLASLAVPLPHLHTTLPHTPFLSIPSFCCYPEVLL